MRFDTVRGTCLGLAVAAGLIGVVGCSHDSNSPKAAVDRREKTVSTIDSMRQDLKNADAEIVATDQSMDRLSTQRSGDLSKTYSDFSSDISKDRSWSEKINSRANDLTLQSYQQITDWNYQARTIDSPQLQQKSLQEEASSRKVQQDMVTALNDVRSGYILYLRQLDDLRTYAANDLTPTGAAGMSGDVQKVRDTANTLRMKMAQLDGKLGTLAAAWSTNQPLAARLQDENAQPAGGTMKPDQTPANTPADMQK